MSRHPNYTKCLLALATLALPTALRAQSPTPGPRIFANTPRLGTQVRLTVRSEAEGEAATTRALIGRIGRLTADSIELYESRTGLPIVLPRGNVERVEKREKRESALAANGIIGGTLGLAGSGYALWRLCRDGTDCWTPPPPEERDTDGDGEDDNNMSVGVASLISGAVLGAFAGYAMTPYGWSVTVLPYALGARGDQPVRGVQVAFNIRVR